MRKGISLVALVITIIVLIILTAAVVLTGGDAPEQAQKAIFFNDIATIQDAITIKMVANLAKMEDPTIEDNKPTSKLYGIIGNTATTLTVVDGENTATKTVYNIVATVESLNLSDIENLNDYAIDTNGKVYFKAGKTFEGKTYYARDVVAAEQSGD